MKNAWRGHTALLGLACKFGDLAVVANFLCREPASHGFRVCRRRHSVSSAQPAALTLCRCPVAVADAPP
jgi:hypothetical protein